MTVRLAIGTASPPADTDHGTEEPGNEVGQLGFPSGHPSLDRPGDDAERRRVSNAERCWSPRLTPVAPKRASQGDRQAPVPQKVEELVRTDPAELGATPEW
nr:hypothetical protein [Halorientalis brevis]